MKESDEKLEQVKQILDFGLIVTLMSKNPTDFTETCLSMFVILTSNNSFNDIFIDKDFIDLIINCLTETKWKIRFKSCVLIIQLIFVNNGLHFSKFKSSDFFESLIWIISNDKMTNVKTEAIFTLNSVLEKLTWSEFQQFLKMYDIVNLVFILFQIQNESLTLRVLDGFHLILTRFNYNLSSNEYASFIQVVKMNKNYECFEKLLINNNENIVCFSSKIRSQFLE